jgi:hypothetical protein
MDVSLEGPGSIREYRFHFENARHGRPSRRASALPIGWSRRFQWTKTEGSGCCYSGLLVVLIQINLA